MTKREQAEAIVDKLDGIGRESDAYEYGLPVYGPEKDLMVNAVLDIIDPRPGDAEIAPEDDE